METKERLKRGKSKPEFSFGVVLHWSKENRASTLPPTGSLFSPGRGYQTADVVRGALFLVNHFEVWEDSGETEQQQDAGVLSRT